jgi:hypothetical protein
MALRRLAGALALACTAACTGNTSSSPAPSGSGLTLLVTQTPEAPGATCPHGGVIVQAGLDSDRNGTLDPTEVAQTEPICNPAPGTAPPVLTRTTAEPAGGNCATGGTRVDAGRDVNRDGVLDDAEVERTSYACAEPVPAPPAVLARVDPVAFGTTCLAGGSAVRYGPDTDGDGVLGDAEVTGVQVVCETQAIPSFTVRTRADAELVSAAAVVDGYLTISIAEPIDLDISPTAVTGGIEVTSSALTGLGVYCWTIGGYVRVEGNPNLARFWLSADAALGGDVVVQDNPALTSLVLPSGKGLYDLYPYRYPQNLVIARNAKLGSLALFEPAEVGGNLVIEENASLTALLLDGLRRVGGDLVLAGNGALEEVPNLVDWGLDTVGGLLDVRDNPRLARLTLRSLQTAGGVRLARDPALSDVVLPKLVAVLGSVTIEDDAVLGLYGPSWPLQVVTGGVYVQRNALLRALRAFGNVASIGEMLLVAENPYLRELGFDRLVQARDVWVNDNPSLEWIGPAPGSGSSLDEPSLTRLESVEQLMVDRNATLRQLVLPAMKLVSHQLWVQDDPVLPQCQATAIPAYATSISGNDTTATCP